jgi:hypothetical protein
MSPLSALPDYRSVLAREWNDLNNTASGLSAYGVVEVVPEPTAIALAVPAMLVLARTPRRARRQRVGPSPR